MTDQEINEAVARKLGWAPVPLSIEQVIPDYCHYIEAAWEIVEFMRKNGRDFNMSVDEGGFAIAWQYDEYIADADTAPMAICLAFLKLQEGKNELTE